MKYTAIILLFLASCSPAKKAKRNEEKAQKQLQEICEAYPKLCNYDTTWVDTLISHRTVIDSSFTMNRIDTIVFEKYGVKTQIFRHYDSFKVLQHQIDTAYVIRTHNVITEKDKFPLLLWLIVGVCLSISALNFWVISRTK